MIKKSIYLLFLHFGSVCYLPSQILSHDFDEKSDFLNFEFSIRLPASPPSLNKKWPSSKERVGSGADVTSSNQDIKTNVATLVCRREVRGSCFMSTLALGNIIHYAVLVVVLF